jgi:Zn-dependent protease
MAWVVLALLGGAMGVEDSSDLTQVAIFVVAGMLCLLVHEFGHAMVGRGAGALVDGVEIAGMGGTTSFMTLPPRRAGYFLMTLAGPVASLLLGLLLGVCFGLQLGNVWAGIRFAFLMPWQDTLPLDLQQQVVMGIYQNEVSHFALQVYSTGMLICFWWSLFNLLPLFPLDGGRLLGSVLNNYLIPCVLGLVVSVILAIWALLVGQWFNVMILGYLAFINWQYFRVLTGRKR